MPRSQAYVLTWTTYGTHLRGDAAGSADHAREGHGPTKQGVNDQCYQHNLERLRQNPVVLSREARTIVEAAICEHAVQKGWEIVALAVRSNHVHVLVRAGPAPEIVMTGFKSWATRALRGATLLEGVEKVWTRHGSTRWINDAVSLEAAWRYITEQQDGDAAAERAARRRGNDDHA